MNLTLPISELLDGVRDAYKQALVDNGNSASGKTASTLRKEQTENTGSLYGARHIYQLKNGRRPGKFPPISDILEWIRAKGIQSKDGKTSEKQLAFLFARKIAEKGTDIYMGKRSALNPDEKIKALIEEFSKKVMVDFIAETKMKLK